MADLTVLQPSRTAHAAGGLTVIRAGAWVPEPVRQALREFDPHSRLGQCVRAIFQYLPLDQAEELLHRLRLALVVESQLALVHIHGPAGLRPGRRDDYGVVARKVITQAAAEYIAKAFAGTQTSGTLISDFKYHGLGTGNTGESVNNIALAAELTTQYATDNTRATGTQTTNTNQYTTVGTNTVDAAVALVEHGIFNKPTVGDTNQTLLDRSVFLAINLAANDSLQSTYTLTISAGG